MKKGFTLIEVMIVVAIIGIVIAIAIPNFVKARRTSQARACQENLTKIDGAKEQWGIEEMVSPGDPAPSPEQLATDKFLKKVPSCPSGGTYSSNDFGNDPTCNNNYPGHNLEDCGSPVSTWTSR